MFLVENKSTNIDLILNFFHNIISKKFLQRFLPLVARSKFADYFIDIILKSQAFRGIFYQEVRNTGLTCQKDSFNSFYLKYLAPAVNSSKIAAKAISQALIKPPYSFTFGLYLLVDYSQRIDEFKNVPQFEKLMYECS